MYYLKTSRIMNYELGYYICEDSSRKRVNMYVNSIDLKLAVALFSLVIKVRVNISRNKSWELVN